MKAIVSKRYGPPDTLKLTDLPMPEPRKGEVRLRVLACAVNLSDWEYLVGTPFYARLAGGLFRPRRAVLGSDIVGLVDAVGPGVVGFAPGIRIMGDLVMTRGGFAEYVCVPASEMIAAPPDLSDEVAASLPQAGGIAVSGTDGLRPGARLLINGAGGGSGTMALHLARAAGAHVTCVDTAAKIGWLKDLGADSVIDYTTTDFTATGETWDVILDMVATRGPGQIARALAPGGRYRAVGGLTRRLLALVFGGLFYRGTGMSIGMLIVPSGAALTERVAALAVQGRLAPHVEQVQPLSGVPEALARTGAGAVRGKIVIRPDMA